MRVLKLVYVHFVGKYLEYKNKFREVKII